MAESATCLVRSFSAPVDTNEGIPHRALGESISFGRYMTETLDWEKWSTFTQKRYVEEAQKYSKPGSVAAKKAYFEAHYKRKAAEKAAPLIQEEANVQAAAHSTFDLENLEGNCTDSSIQVKSEADNIETANEQINNIDTVNSQVVDCDATNKYECGIAQSGLDVPEVEGAKEGPHQSECDVGQNLEGNCTDSSKQVKSEADNIETANEQIYNKDTVNSQVVDCDGTNQYECDFGQSALDVPEVEGAKEVPRPCYDTDLNVLSCMVVDNSNQPDHVEDKKSIAIPMEEKVPDQGIAGQEVLALPVKEVNSSPKSSTKTRATKLSDSRDERKAIAAVLPRNGLNNGLKRQNSIGDAAEKKRLAARSLRMSISLPSGTGETNKTAAAGLQSRISTSKKSLAGSVEKKRSTASSLHMSINVPTGTSVARKTAATALAGLVEKKRLTASSLHMSINVPTGTSFARKTAGTFVKTSNGKNIAPKSMKSVGASMEKKPTARSLNDPISMKSFSGSVEKKRSTASSLHMSINIPTGASVASKTAATVVKTSNGINIAPKGMKSVGASMEKKPTARSLHMSISVPSGAGQTSKTAPVFEHKKISSNVPKDHPVASQTSTEASANLPSQGRSCLKSSSTTKTIPKAQTISSPFRFRSEERAIKRREFLQKLEETKGKKEWNVQLQRISKGKTQLDYKKLEHSSSSKSKLNEDRQSESQSPSNQIRKFSLKVPQSPKPVRKASCSTVRDKNMGNSQKPPISSNNSKHITERVNRTRESETSFSNDTTRENASPNIQK